MSPFRRGLAAAVINVVAAAGVSAETLTVAVASNFATTAGELAAAFETETGYDVVLVRGSSGKLYAQIVNGAPFDVFLSADAERARKLEDSGLALPGSRFTYAIGQLVAWSRDPALAGADCLQALGNDAPGRIAIANPGLAPYGLAAKQYLQHAGLWERLEGRLVIGESIAQTLQFAAAGGARIGLVAVAQLDVDGLPAASCMTPVPAGTHAPIEQQAVVLTRAQNGDAALAFASFLNSAAARQAIAKAGYLLPESGGETG